MPWIFQYLSSPPQCDLPSTLDSLPGPVQQVSHAIAHSFSLSNDSNSNSKSKGNSIFYPPHTHQALFETELPLEWRCPHSELKASLTFTNKFFLKKKRYICSLICCVFPSPSIVYLSRVRIWKWLRQRLDCLLPAAAARLHHQQLDHAQCHRHTGERASLQNTYEIETGEMTYIKLTGSQRWGDSRRKGFYKNWQVPPAYT